MLILQVFKAIGRVLQTLWKKKKTIHLVQNPLNFTELKQKYGSLNLFTESFKLYGKETKQYSHNLFTEELTIDPVMADGKM